MKSCVVGIQMIVLSFEFHQNQLSGFGAVGGRNFPIPTDLATDLYNSLYYRTRTSRDDVIIIFYLQHGCPKVTPVFTGRIHGP